MKQNIAVVAIIVVVLFIGFEIEKYKFTDCKKVGHTTLYCIFNLGK